ncbi:MAG: cytochrome c maturation protein CcmE [Croceibacterium sp.]
MTSALKPKHQRLVLLAIAFTVLIGAALLAAWGLRTQASFYYLPSELLAAHPSPDQPGRLGGMVDKGSLKSRPDGVTIDFMASDEKAHIPVTYRGIVPDLFVEGSWMVAEGHLAANGGFVADTIIAKHDENYVPRELADMTAQQKREAIAETSR